MADASAPSVPLQLFERVKNLSMAIVTASSPEWIFATIPSEARGSTLIVHDEGYLNEVEKAENRYFIVCPDQTTYSVILNLMLSENVIAQTKTKSKYWTRVTKKLEKGEMYRNTPSLSTPVQEVANVGAGPERTVIQAYVQVDAMIMSMFSQRARIALTNPNFNALGLVGVPPPPHDHRLGPTGKRTCLPVILTYSRPWTPRGAHRALRMASKEVKSLTGGFRRKYETLIHTCKDNERVNLTFEGAMAIVNGIQDRVERKKWIVAQIRTMDRFNNDVDIMLAEYCAIMAHCQRLQQACIAAASEAYNIEIVIVPTNLLPPATLS